MPNTNDNAVRLPSDDAELKLLTLRQELDETKRELASLRNQVLSARARGTRDITKPQRPQSLEERIEIALRVDILSLEEVSKAIDAAPQKVAQTLVEARAAGKVQNIGSEDRPRWTWRIGDATSTVELTEVVRRLITYQPMALAEIASATGAKTSRISGSLVAIQRSGDMVMDVGTQGHARWFRIGPGARDARLSPKKEKK